MDSLSSSGLSLWPWAEVSWHWGMRFFSEKKSYFGDVRSELRLSRDLVGPRKYLLDRASTDPCTRKPLAALWIRRQECENSPVVPNPTTLSISADFPAKTHQIFIKPPCSPHFSNCSCSLPCLQAVGTMNSTDLGRPFFAKVRNFRQFYSTLWEIWQWNISIHIRHLVRYSTPFSRQQSNIRVLNFDGFSDCHENVNGESIPSWLLMISQSS